MHSDLAVGKRFPDLTLPDHRQQLTTLSELPLNFIGAKNHEPGR